jgi:hypothetical protein
MKTRDRVISCSSGMGRDNSRYGDNINGYRVEDKGADSFEGRDCNDLYGADICYIVHKGVHKRAWYSY